MEPLCPIKNPLEQRIKLTQMRSCLNEKFMMCSDSHYRCKNPQFAFKMDHANKTVNDYIDKEPKLKDISIDDTKMIWSEFEIGTPKKDHKENAQYAMAFGTHLRTNTPVVLKMFLKGRYVPNEKLEYETCVYKQLKDFNLPHVVKGVYVYEFDDSDSSYTEITERHYGILELDKTTKGFNTRTSLVNFALMRQSVWAKFRALYDTKNKDEKLRFAQESQNITLCVSITHLINGPNLFQYLSKQQRGHETVRSIVFQIAFALHALNRSGIQHNDLHTGNIIVDENPESEMAVYYIEGNIYEIPLPVKIYIFDFDLASSNWCGENKYLTEKYYATTLDKDKKKILQNGNFCFHIGVCQERNLKFDLYTVMRHLLPMPNFKRQTDPKYQHIKPDIELYDALAKLFPAVAEKYVHRFDGYTYKGTAPRNVGTLQDVLNIFANSVIGSYKVDK